MAVFTKSSHDLVAYFDESMGEGRLPMTAVTGYLFEPHAYLKFERGMKHLLRENKMCYFRMADSIKLRGVFEKFQIVDPDQPEKIKREVIRLTREYAVIGVGVAVSEARYQLLQPRHLEKIMTGAYGMLCQWCLAEIGSWAKRQNFNGKIHYFFEAGCSSQSDANAVLNKISNNEEFKRQYRYGSHDFIPKMQRRGLQAADMLAWFSRREAEDTGRLLSGVQTKGRRKDFQALIGNTNAELKTIGHLFKYFDDESLKSFVSDDQNTDPALRWYNFTPAQRLP
jgi:hypothetical protein